MLYIPWKYVTSYAYRFNFIFYGPNIESNTKKSLLDTKLTSTYDHNFCSICLIHFVFRVLIAPCLGITCFCHVFFIIWLWFVALHTLRQNLLYPDKMSCLSSLTYTTSTIQTFKEILHSDKFAVDVSIRIYAALRGLTAMHFNRETCFIDSKFWTFYLWSPTEKVSRYIFRNILQAIVLRKWIIYTFKRVNLTYTI